MRNTLMFMLVTVALVLSACGGGQVATEAPAGTGEPAAGGTADNKVVTLIWTQEFDTLNPLYTNMWFVTVLFPVYMCQAWWFDDQNAAIPNLVPKFHPWETGVYPKTEKQSP